MDGSVHLGSITCQFPGTTGLKYRNPDTQGWRLVKVFNDCLQMPKEGWMNVAYLCIRPNDMSSGGAEKRKGGFMQGPNKRTPFSNISTTFSAASNNMRGGGMNNGMGGGMNNGMGMNGMGNGMNNGMNNGMGMN